MSTTIEDALVTRETRAHALSYFRHVENANAEVDVAKDAVGVLRVQLVDEGLLSGGRPNWEGCTGILSYCVGSNWHVSRERGDVLTFTMDKTNTMSS